MMSVTDGAAGRSDEVCGNSWMEKETSRLCGSSESVDRDCLLDLRQELWWDPIPVSVGTLSTLGTSLPGFPAHRVCFLHQTEWCWSAECQCVARRAGHVRGGDRTTSHTCVGVGFSSLLLAVFTQEGLTVCCH